MYHHVEIKKLSEAWIIKEYRISLYEYVSKMKDDLNDKY